MDWVRLVGPNRAVEIFGVKLVGVNAENGRKLVFMLIYIALVLLLGWALRTGTRWLLSGRGHERVVFWSRQAIQLFTALLMLVGIASIWFDDPARFATALGLVTAGLAFALQKAVTALAGYFVILRGKTFNVGDRIRMGGVRGDVIALGFMQTTIMEMGQPPPVQQDEPAMWVQSRQYTGRIVSISNAKIFDEPVYNYTRQFPYIWEELTLSIGYDADRRRAERILLEVATEHTLELSQLSREAAEELQRRHFVRPSDLRPRVYYRLTENWLELTVRFICEDHGIRELKDALSRDIIARLESERIAIATTSLQITAMPPLRVDSEARNADVEDRVKPKSA